MHLSPLVCLSCVSILPPSLVCFCPMCMLMADVLQVMCVCMRNCLILCAQKASSSPGWTACSFLVVFAMSCNLYCLPLKAFHTHTHTHTQSPSDEGLISSSTADLSSLEPHACHCGCGSKRVHYRHHEPSARDFSFPRV
jgi:hypothetical protein